MLFSRALKPLAVLTVLAAVSTAFGAAAQARGMAEYKAIAAKFKGLLPAPLQAWKQTKPVAIVMNSAFQKEMSGKSIYRPTRTVGADKQLSIFIGAKPGWRKSWTEPLFADAAKAKKRGYDLVTINGRKFLKKIKRENITYITLLERGITVKFAAKWLKEDAIKPYLAAVDYQKVAAVK